MQEDYEESISLTLRTWSSRKSFRMQEENWKHQWLQPCLARLARKTSMERPVARLMISDLDLRVSWKPVNPQECVRNNLYRNIMRTILQEKETFHCSITIWFTNLFLCLKPWRYAQQKQQWLKKWKKLEKIPAWDMTKVRSKSEVIDEARNEGHKSSFCLIDGHVSFEECRIGTKAPKIQRSSCTPRRYCKRRLRVLCSIYRTRITSTTNDGSKSHGYHIQTARVRRTSSWRSIG